MNFKAAAVDVPVVNGLAGVTASATSSFVLIASMARWIDCNAPTNASAVGALVGALTRFTNFFFVDVEVLAFLALRIAFLPVLVGVVFLNLRLGTEPKEVELI